jgi:EAL domain-containing protein (putative c-di-GMP-specific phosphodiesterase class I)
VSGQLLIDADQAMYRAKRSRSGRSRGRGIGRRDIADYVLENDLRAALAAEELNVVYQPIVAVPSGRVEAVEALLRWNHPTRGAIDPRTVVGIAERSNLINEVGAWVLEHACRDHARWTQHHPTLAVSVNLSARQLATAGLAEAIGTLLTTTSMDPTKLVLEITETMLVDDSNAPTSTLTKLDALGIRLALDDFGSGYSSLSYLDRLPIRIIKVDQQFTSRLGRSDDSTIVIRGIVAIAHELGLVVVAEGVETDVQHDHVAATGCDSAQGFHYSVPLNGDQLGAYLIGTGATARRVRPAGAPDRVFEDA